MEGGKEDHEHRLPLRRAGRGRTGAGDEAAARLIPVGRREEYRPGRGT